MRRKVMAMVMAAMTMAAAMAVPAMADEESVTIGISQFAEHGSLDNCREGFLPISLQSRPTVIRL